MLQQSESVLNSSIFPRDLSNIKQLIFQGGSVKGIAYLGAIEELEKRLDFRNITDVGGTSAGGITALLLAMGYDVEATKNLQISFPFEKILDDKKGGIATQKKILKTVEKSQTHGKFFSKLPAKSVKLPILSRLKHQFGIYEGEYFRTWAEEMIQTQVNEITGGRHDGRHLTFKQLHQLTLDYPGQFRNLHVVGVNLNLGESVVFSHESSEVEDVIIADAIRITMSIPFLFKPHHIYFNVDGERLVDSKRHLWVDGGLFDNYPIHIFDTANEEQLIYNPSTLGFRLVSEESQNYFASLSDAPEAEIDNIVVFFKSILSSTMKKQESDHRKRPADIRRTVYIDNLGISTFAFNIKPLQQEALINSGKRAMQLYCDGRTVIDEPENVEYLEDEVLPEELKSRCIMQ